MSILSVYGTGDPYVAMNTAKKVLYADDFEEVMLPGISHRSMMDDPSGVNHAICNFLKQRGMWNTRKSLSLTLYTILE